jgi:hypothetical protein
MAKAKKTEKKMYIGPDLSRGRLQHGQVYIGGLPTHLAAEFESLPALERLFVPLTEVDAAIKETQKAGTPLNKYYRQAMEV